MFFIKGLRASYASPLYLIWRTCFHQAPVEILCHSIIIPAAPAVQLSRDKWASMKTQLPQSVRMVTTGYAASTRRPQSFLKALVGIALSIAAIKRGYPTRQKRTINNLASLPCSLVLTGLAKVLTSARSFSFLLPATLLSAILIPANQR
jgi:hypothetical protein